MLEEIIKKQLEFTRNHCAFKSAFLPKGWTCVNIEKCTKDLTKIIKSKLYVCGKKEN